MDVPQFLSLTPSFSLWFGCHKEPYIFGCKRKRQYDKCLKMLLDTLIVNNMEKYINIFTISRLPVQDAIDNFQSNESTPCWFSREKDKLWKLYKLKYLSSFIKRPRCWWKRDGFEMKKHLFRSHTTFFGYPPPWSDGKFIRDDVEWGLRGKIKSEITVVCDAGPVIHLDELGCLDLLNDFQEVLLPNTVWEEIKRHRPSALTKRICPLFNDPGNRLLVNHF